MADSNAPPEFAPLFRTSPFLDLVGPLYYRRNPERGLVIGFRVEAKHANARGLAHGGVLLTLADVALGYATAFSVDPPAALVTTNISATSPARPASETGSKPTSTCSGWARAWPSRTRTSPLATAASRASARSSRAMTGRSRRRNASRSQSAFGD